MASFTINGNTYLGNSISVMNGKVIIDGIDVTPNTKEININVDGDVTQLSVDACNKAIINGDVGYVKTQSGNVDITGNVSGDVETMSGNVNCNDVGGDISTKSGNVKYKK
jgi:hypothetical protein